MRCERWLTMTRAGGEACAAGAQDYPTKPVRILVPYPPGGASDVTARVLGDKISKRWGRKAVFVENKAGANGMIGAENDRAGGARRPIDQPHRELARDQPRADGRRCRTARRTWRPSPSRRRCSLAWS